TSMLTVPRYSLWMVWSDERGEEFGFL
ncbi:hypothetical protein GCK32_021317, partial [Trichostrongylus colubriformis]